ncbi:MAG: hypothetical protein RQ739_05575 [Desulfotignum sp.]|nr:hypothetical protein [Desulfotignum sp.]
MTRAEPEGARTCPPGKEVLQSDELPWPMPGLVVEVLMRFMKNEP